MNILKPQENDSLYSTSFVEVRERNGNYGVYSLKDFKEGELVLREPITCSYVMRQGDFNGKQSDACAFVEAIYRSPDILGKEYKAFLLETIEGVFETPPVHEWKFLKKLSRRLKKPYEGVLDTWRIICTYHVRNYLHSDGLKVRLQLSNLFNRINHHCSPNSAGENNFFTYEDFKKPFAEVRAIRDIDAGDEITFSYISPMTLCQNVRIRQSEILSCYDFICTCSKCESEK
jgi:hypothetical protein